MPARRCPDCDANWPNIPDYWHCPGCGKRTGYVMTAPNKSLSDASAARAERIANVGNTPKPPGEYDIGEEFWNVGDALYGHRFDRFTELGFSEASAQILADAKDRLGFPLYWGVVAKSLAAGCTHEMALVIFA
jgi:hypothetical protein